jgi:hypothetical protein
VPLDLRPFAAGGGGPPRRLEGVANLIDELGLGGG